MPMHGQARDDVKEKLGATAGGSRWQGGGFGGSPDWLPSSGATCADVVVVVEWRRNDERVNKIREPKRLGHSLKDTGPLSASISHPRRYFGQLVRLSAAVGHCTAQVPFEPRRISHSRGDAHKYSLWISLIKLESGGGSREWGAKRKRCRRKSLLMKL